MSVAFEPPANNLQFYYTPTTRLSLPYTTDNNLALKPYNKDVYSMLPALQALSYAVVGLALGGFLFGLIAGGKLIGVEMMMVVQVAYIGLISIDKL